MASCAHEMRAGEVWGLCCRRCGLAVSLAESLRGPGYTEVQVRPGPGRDLEVADIEFAERLMRAAGLLDPAEWPSVGFVSADGAEVEVLPAQRCPHYPLAGKPRRGVRAGVARRRKQRRS